MIPIKKEGIVLEKTTLVFENEGVMNPATLCENGRVHLFYRAVRKGNYSSIGKCVLEGPLKVDSRRDMPVMVPECDYESHGVEDPRITRIGDTYYLSYTAYDGINALGALATSSDLEHFERQGIIVPQLTYDEFKRLAECRNILNEKYGRYNAHYHLQEQHDLKAMMWDKNIVFFPRKIQGKICFLHRIKPDIQFVSVQSMKDLTKEFWVNYFLHFEESVVLAPKFSHEVSYIGGGCPPVETQEGWLLIYHGVHDTNNGYVYTACAALLDLENPPHEIARLPYPLFQPEEEWEQKGEVNNVCFPTGTALFGDTLYIYYGAADERVAAASVSLTALVAELLLNPSTA